MSDNEQPDEEEDDEPTLELRSTLLGVPEGEPGVRLPGGTVEGTPEVV